MIPPTSESRFDELYLRYWENGLSDAETAEFAGILERDPLARDWFRANGLLAVTAADLPAGGPVPQPLPEKRGWSRRRILQYLGGGLAAGIAAGFAGRNYLTGSKLSPVQLRAAKGGVTVTTASGRPHPPEGPIPDDATVITHGTNSSAVLVFPNGSDVLLAGDSSVALSGDNNRRLKLMRGSAIADVLPLKFGERAFSFLTTEALVSAVGGVRLTLTHTARTTEVGVHTGEVAVTDPSGGPLDSVRSGELFVVSADGRQSKQPLPGTPENYALDLKKSLPDGWFVGTKQTQLSGPVVRPELWFDPYHQAEMYQIRSHNRWAEGLVRLLDDSIITVKYRVRSSGKGQVCLVSRTESMKEAATGVLEWNGTYRAGGWQTLSVRAADMLECREAPKFRSPWVMFLFIFNTYGSDLGLEVADFRVSRPGGGI